MAIWFDDVATFLSLCGAFSSALVDLASIFIPCTMGITGAVVGFEFAFPQPTAGPFVTPLVGLASVEFS